MVAVNLSESFILLRLDFEAFSIAQPEPTEHRCVTDSFLVTGTTNPVPIICGDNTGQHSKLNSELYHFGNSFDFNYIFLVT